MRFRSRRNAAILALAFSVLSCRTIAPSTPHEPALHALFADLHLRGAFSGTVAVGDRGRIVWEDRFGAAEGSAGRRNELFNDAQRGRSIVHTGTIEPWLQKPLIRAVNRILDGGGYAPIQRPVVSVVRPELRDALSGGWRLEDGTRLHIDSAGETATLTSGGTSHRMVQLDPSFFYVEDLDLMISFAKGVDRGFATIFVESNRDARRGARE